MIYHPHMERMTDTRWSNSVTIYAQSFLLTVPAVLPAAVVMPITAGRRTHPCRPS